MKRLTTLFAGVAILSIACYDSTVIEPSDVAPSFATGSAVTICHFPPSNSGNPQVISVGAKAAADHIAQHEGDGIVGVDFDENCQPLALHAWGQGALFTYEANPDGARHFPFNVLLATGTFNRFCDFTNLSHPVDLVLNDATVIGEVSVDCGTLNEMSFTFTITGPYVLREIEGLINNVANCTNFATVIPPISLTDLSEISNFSQDVIYTSKNAEGLTTETLAPLDALKVFTDQLSCAVAHALVVPS